MTIYELVYISNLKNGFSKPIFRFIPAGLLERPQSARIISGAILINMNPQDNHYPFLHADQINYPPQHYKGDQNDKTTHLCQEQEYQLRQNDEFGWRSPFKPSSFFLTSNSPKHFQFDIVGSDYGKSSFNKVILPVCSIDKKINLNALDEEQASENQIIQEEVQVYSQKKNASTRSIKNVKGLRSLSESVYKIVSQLHKTKYKVVAQRLIEDITKDGASLEGKDQHNVKRRVYDALNVLIAAGMLQKQGKDVVCNLPYQKTSRRVLKSGNSWQMIEKQKMELQIKKKSDSIAEKQILLERLRIKKQNVSKILHRNISEPQAEESLLRFPLICTTIEEQNIQLLRNYQTQVIFRFPSFPLIYGDIDLLQQIKPAQQLPLQQPVQPQNIYNVIFKQEELQPQLKKEIKLEIFQEYVKIQEI